jgi:hypothetical protein
MIPFQADADRQCGHRHRYVGPEEAILAYSWLTGQPTIIFQDGLNERCPEVGLWEFRPITRRGFPCVAGYRGNRKHGCFADATQPMPWNGYE